MNTAYVAFPSEKKSVRFQKNKIHYIEITGKNSGFQFLNASYFNLNYDTPDNMLKNFLSLSQLCKDKFNINTYSIHVKTITQIAHLYYMNSSLPFNSISFISPSKDIFNKIYGKEVRFGYIFAETTKISDTSDFKTFLQLDFSKFYSCVLQQQKLLFNIPIEFHEYHGTFKKSKPSLKHETLSNLFFSTLEFLCEGHFQYGLLSKEMRFNSFPQDCVFSWDGQFKDVMIITFFGLMIINHFSKIYLFTILLNFNPNPNPNPNPYPYPNPSLTLP